MYSREFLVAMSPDRTAVEEAALWRAAARQARPWQRGRRNEAERLRVEAEERAVAAGLDWERLPRPQAGLAAPDRSARQRLGRRLPPPDSPVPGGLRTLLRRRVSRSPASPPPAALVQPDGGGVAALAGQPVPGEVSGSAALQWLRAGPAPAHANNDGGAWFAATDGSLWYRDPQGAHFALATDGASLLPVSDDGLLYAQDGAGTWHTSLADGTSLTLADNGQLVTQGGDGSLRLLADDGLLYLVAPGALYPIAEHGEILTEAGIGLDGAGIPLDETDGFEGGVEAVDGFLS